MYIGKTVCVIGGGAFGTSMAQVAARTGKIGYLLDLNDSRLIIDYRLHHYHSADHAHDTAFHNVFFKIILLNFNLP